MNPKITFIGAGSTVFMRNIVGDVLQRPALINADIRLMDIDARRLAESEMVATKLIENLGAGATVTAFTDQRAALDGADAVVTAFQIGGYDPCTITDFDIPKSFGLEQTIADTLGVGGIMRGIRTVPHLWKVCEDMMAVCPEATLLQYVNPMAINTWAIAARYPTIKQVGLCHSVQGTALELATDLGISVESLRYRAAGINHMAFYLNFEQRQSDGSYKNLYPDLLAGYVEGRMPGKFRHNPRCDNLVRYEMFKRTGYFVTESSEHFAEYTPWFIKRDRPDLIEKFAIPIDEYPKRCVEQIENWAVEIEKYQTDEPVEITTSHEYASSIINSLMTGEPSVVYGNVANSGQISSLPNGCAVEVPCLVDLNGVQPTMIGELPAQLTAMIRTNVSVQELTVKALMEEDVASIYHAAMMDPHTAAELDLEQIWQLVDQLREAHGEWLPEWARTPRPANLRSA